jgi:hypothetical protein
MRFIQLWRRAQLATLKLRCHCTTLYTVKFQNFIGWIVIFLFTYYIIFQWIISVNFHEDLWPNRSHNRCWSSGCLETLWNTLDWGSADRKAADKNLNSSGKFRIHEIRVLAKYRRVTWPHVLELNLSIYFVFIFPNSEVTYCMIVGIYHFQYWGRIFLALCALLRTPSSTP